MIRINKFHYTYFKVYCCLANFKCVNCTYKLTIGFKLFKYFTLRTGYCQSVIFLNPYILSILLISLTASSGSLISSNGFSTSTFISDSSLSVCSIIDLHNFSRILLFLILYDSLVSPGLDSTN